MMTPGHIEQVEAAKRAGKRMVGGLYRRTRPTKDGAKVSRWEVRFDDVAGCLRVPTGGSSRQTVMIVEGASVRSRLLSPREAARLMGLADDYTLPANTNEAYGLMGDGVVVPVVRHLAQHILEPVLAAQGDQIQAAGVADAADGEINIWDGVDIEDEIDTANEVELDESSRDPRHRSRPRWRRGRTGRARRLIACFDLPTIGEGAHVASTPPILPT